MLRKLLLLPLLLSASLAFATPIVLTVEGTGPSKSAGLANGPDHVVTHDAAGAFTDLFTLQIDGPSWIDAQISVQWIDDLSSSMKIDFDPANILIGGHSFHMVSQDDSGGQTKFVYAASPFLFNGGTLDLSVSGWAGGLAPEINVGDEIMASYSGQVNINAVPEPASLALVGVALGGLAWTRRRKA